MDSEPGLDRFAGRVALVTGAAGGLGAAFSAELVRAGMRVAGVDIAQQPLQALSERLSGLRGQFHPIIGDVSRQEDLERVFQWLEDNLGGVSVLLNNAGKLLLARTEDAPFESVAELININVTGVIAVASKTIQSMKKHNITDGHIINMGSTAGHPQAINLDSLQRFPASVYVVSKHAVTALSHALRTELRALPGFSIRVTNLCPGFTKTPLIDSAGVQRALQPKDIVRVVRFILASPPEVEVSEITVQLTA